VNIENTGQQIQRVGKLRIYCMKSVNVKVGDVQSWPYKEQVISRAGILTK
jgi:hypothetical protein